MRIKDFNTYSEAVLFDDTTLKEMLVTLKNEIEIKKNRLDKVLNKKDNYENYLNVTIAKLAYALVKEEYTTLFTEAQKRGLII